MIDKITGNAISNNAIISSLIADLSITERKLANASVDIDNFLTSTINQFRVVKLTEINYPSGVVADSGGGQVITVAGEGFALGARVYVGNIECTTTYISSEVLIFNSPSMVPGVYWVTVTNADGSSVTKPNAIVYDGAPLWYTPSGNLGIVTNTTSSNITVRANSLGAVSYTIDSGYLPPGFTLSSSGYITGILAAGTAVAESYFFRIRATSNNGPYSSRSFFLYTNPSITVNNIIYPGTNQAASAVGGDVISLSGINFDTNLNVYVQGSSISFTRTNASFISFTMPALRQSNYPATVATRSETYTYASNGIYTFTPSIAGNIEAVIWGAGGGSSARQGGAGGYSRGAFPVVPGTTYYIVVGQAGQLGPNNRSMIGFPGRGTIGTATSGATGGGFSGVFANAVTRANAIIMAGGGGGASFLSNGGAGGGNIGQNGSNPGPNINFAGNSVNFTANGIYLFYSPTLSLNVSVKTWGAGGGNGFASGGGGGFSSGFFTANAGIPYLIVVGTGGRANAASATGMVGGAGNGTVGGNFTAGQPTGGDGGSGGGFSGIFANAITQGNAIIMAGGGGGSNNLFGGGGGGLAGGDGAPSGYNPGVYSEGGKGGTQIAGGNGGGGADGGGLAGNVLFGGNSQAISTYVSGLVWAGGGAGGGGYFGGGSGASGALSRGAGGGGSGFINANVVIAGNTQTGNSTIVANDLDPARGTAGNPGTDGAVLLTFDSAIGGNLVTSGIGGSQSSGGTGGFGIIMRWIAPAITAIQTTVGANGIAFNGGSALEPITIAGAVPGAAGGGGGYFGGGSGTTSNTTNVIYSIDPTLIINGNSTSGAGGSGYLNYSVLTTGNTQTGNLSVPGNSTDPLRGTAGDPQTDGKVVLTFTYPTSTEVYLTNPDGRSTTATIRYSLTTVARPKTGPLYMILSNGNTYSTSISVIGGTTVNYSASNPYPPLVQFDSGTFNFYPSLISNTNFGQGLYPINVSIVNQDNFVTTQTYSFLIRNTQFANLSLQYLLVGGGGGGGWFGGGGAGGIVTGNIWANLNANLESVAYSVIVGQGGSSGQNPSPGLPTFISLNNQSLARAEGGGSGGSVTADRSGEGASTGGAASNAAASTNFISGQGNFGGNANARAGGGGGGAAASGAAATNPSANVWQGGAGGAGSNVYTTWGLATNTGQLVGNLVFYAGGGGGAGVDISVDPVNWSYPGSGGSGGGGAGILRYSNSSVLNNSSGTPNTGGGAGAIGNFPLNLNQTGGSGIAIIRYAGNQHSTGGTVTSVGGFTYHTFTVNGTFNPYGLLTEFPYTGPVWLSTQSNLGVYAETGNISVTLSSLGASSNVSYVLTSGTLPANIFLDSNTGVISGSFITNSIGNSIFTISSVDPSGSSTPRTFFINVVTAPRILTISGNSTTFPSNIGSGDLVTVTGSNFANGAIAYIENAPLTTTFINANLLTFTAPTITAGLDYDEGGNALVGISRWSPTTTFQMTDFGGIPNMIAHGYNASTTFTFTYLSLPPHDQIRYTLRWHLVDSLDGETNFMNIDGVRYLTFTKVYTTPPSVSFSLLANNSFTVSSYSYRPWANGAYGQDGYITIDTGWITHTAANIVVQHFIGADQGQTDEAEYLSNVRLQTRSLSGDSTGSFSNVRIVNPNGISSPIFLAYYSTLPIFITPEGALPTFSDVSFSTNIAISINSIGNVAVIAGSLPPGLTATVASLGNIIISGNIESTASTLYDFTLRLTDGEGQFADRSFSVRVAAAPKITSVINPPTGFYDPQYQEAGTVLGQDFVTGCTVFINNVAQTTNFVNSQCVTFSTTGGLVAGFTVGGVLTYSNVGLYTWTVPGNVRLAQVYLWGAGGGGGTAGGWNFGAPGGAGGAASGLINVTPGATLGITVGGGGQVNSTTSAVGGGGIANRTGSDNRYGSGGGGYSAIFTSNTASQANTIIMAGGGGGGGSSRAGTGNQGGAGGGLIGEDGVSAYDNKPQYRGRGGTQIAAGATASSDATNTGVFQGALQGGTSPVNGYGGAGGGGYWGGSGGGYSESNTMGGGGGGSGYLSNLVTNGVLTAGNLTVAGDSTNSLRGTAGNAGAVATAGTAGRVVIIYYIGNTSTYQLQVVNPDNVASLPTTVTYTSPPTWFSATSLGPITVGDDFYTTLVATGDAPLSYNILENATALPLVLNSATGNLFIRPGESAVGTKSFTIRVLDANLQYRDQKLSITTVYRPVITEFSYPLTANSSAVLPNVTLTGVSITSTTGQFTSNVSRVNAGDRILISGNPIVAGIITGYSNPTMYWVATTLGNTFVLSNSAVGGTVTTVAGNTAGLVLTRIPFVANPPANVFSIYGGETVTVTGRNFTPGATLSLSNLTPVTGNALVSRVSTTFVSSSILQFTTPTLQAGFYSLTVTNTDGYSAQAPATLRFTMPPYWTTFTSNLGRINNVSIFSTNISAIAESNITYSLWGNSIINSNVTLNAQTGQILGIPVITAPTISYFSVAATNEEGQFAVREFFLIIN